MEVHGPAIRSGRPPRTRTGSIRISSANQILGKFPLPGYGTQVSTAPQPAPLAMEGPEATPLLTRPSRPKRKKSIVGSLLGPSKNNDTTKRPPTMAERQQTLLQLKQEEYKTESQGTHGRMAVAHSPESSHAELPAHAPGS